MEFPTNWVVFSLPDYDTETPAVSGDFTVELFTQLHNTGRILDGFRFALDGNKALEAYVDLDRILPTPELMGLQAFFQCWPRDIKICRNMLTSPWVSITDGISSNDVDILDEGGAGVAAGTVLRILERLPGTGPTNASTRWAVTVGADSFLKLQLQGLPLVASALNNRSTFKGYVHEPIARSIGSYTTSRPTLRVDNVDKTIPGIVRLKTSRLYPIFRVTHLSRPSNLSLPGSDRQGGGASYLSLLSLTNQDHDRSGD
jgi:hypothetical protein